MKQIVKNAVSLGNLKDWQKIKSSFTNPLFSLESYSWVKISLVLFNLLNWIVAGSLVTVYIMVKSQDFATYLLVLFILNLVLFSSVYVVMKVRI